MSANTVCLCGGEFSTQVLLVQHANERGHLIRCSCHRLFKTHQHLQDHQRDVHPHDSGRFDLLALVLPPSSHGASPPAPHTCTSCNKQLANEHGLAAHKQAKHPWSCPICLQDFGTHEKLEGHQKAASHCYCHEHLVSFTSLERLQRHVKRSIHVTGFECTDCDRSFKSGQALSDHLDSKGHYEVELAVQAKANAAAQAASASAQRNFITPEEEASLRCDDCNRSFKDFAALGQHKNSIKHNPLSDLRCPLSDECIQTFTSPSAFIFHLEGGKCKSGMDRAKLNAIVHEHDTGRHITSAANIQGVIVAAAVGARLEFDGISNTAPSSLSDLAEELSELGISQDVSDADSTTSTDDNGVPVFTPTASVSSLSRSRSSSFAGGIDIHRSAIAAADEISFLSGIHAAPMPAAYDSTSPPSAFIDLDVSNNQQDFVCPIAKCERSFKQQISLLEHLKSPAHDPELYHCPISLALPGSQKRAKSFKTLSGILQHLEAGACVGGKEVLGQIFAMVEAKIMVVTGTTVKLLRDREP